MDRGMSDLKFFKLQILRSHNKRIVQMFKQHLAKADPLIAFG